MGGHFLIPAMSTAAARRDHFFSYNHTLSSNPFNNEPSATKQQYSQDGTCGGFTHPDLSSMEHVISGCGDLLFLEKDREYPAEQAALPNQICPTMSTCWVYISSDISTRQSPLHVQCFFHIPSSGINVNTHFLNLLYLCLFWPLFQLPAIMRFGFSAHLLGQISSWKLLLVLDGTFFHFSPRIPMPLEIDLCICLCFQVVPPKGESFTHFNVDLGTLDLGTMDQCFSTQRTFGSVCRCFGWYSWVGVLLASSGQIAKYPSI